MGIYYGPQENENSNEIERQLSIISTHIHTLKQKHDVILRGDFNAKVTTPNQKVSRNGKYLMEMMTETNTMPVSLKAKQGEWTRINRNNTTERSIIDYIIIEQENETKTLNITIDEECIHPIKNETIGRETEQ